MKINVILPCAGSGSRAGLGYNKSLSSIDGKSVVATTAEAFDIPQVTRIVVACGRGEADDFTAALTGISRVVIIAGGDTRTASVAAALKSCEPDCDIVAIHDGARPYLSTEMLERGISAAEQSGAAIPTVPVSDSLRLISKEGSTAVDRAQYVAVQTPQLFRYRDIAAAYEMAAQDNFQATDDAQIYEKYIGKVALYDGDRRNVKLTYPSDFPTRQAVGCGFDTHRLAQGRALILGGVNIPHDKGLLGHSDADVLVHAIMDALLSCVNERDIGVHFPDTDEQYRGISSIVLLGKVKEILDSHGAEVGNVSAVIMAQRPKLKDYIPVMCRNIADTLGIQTSRVSISATTTEGIGLVGREEGISVHATAAVNIKD
ncbi:MAG: 2-C-methyl-D-erythritol 2,4-cyclodiphosphate synthase [Clostridia bacterium]|nr:2-C-methyl-D-erythritol 2,4-cyclodiphosphate synthase [Clostridia bacterium]